VDGKKPMLEKDNTNGKILYGQETRKALENFGPGEMPPEFIRALAEAKLAVLHGQQQELSLLSEESYSAVEKALEQIIQGNHDRQFPLSPRQGGAGTSFHMNLLEVVSNLSKEINPEVQLDPWDDLNQGQSTNDLVPTAITIMALREVDRVGEKSHRASRMLHRTGEQIPRGSHGWKNAVAGCPPHYPGSTLWELCRSYCPGPMAPSQSKGTISNHSLGWRCSWNKSSDRSKGYFCRRKKLEGANQTASEPITEPDG
jgi:hypothetical protein